MPKEKILFCVNVNILTERNRYWNYTWRKSSKTMKTNRNMNIFNRFLNDNKIKL